MHGSVLGFFAYGALQGREVADRDVLEVGSLDVNGSVRAMVEARQPRSYIGVDVVDGPGVDQVLDATDLIGTFGMDAFDVVVSTEMLEHATDWQAALIAMAAVLRPGGVLVVTTRSPGFAWHHPPDRWRFTQQAFSAAADLLDLEVLVLMDDPEYPGVFVKYRRPPLGEWQPRVDDLVGDIGGVTPMREPSTWLGLPFQPDGTGYYRFWQPWTQLARRSGHTALIPPPGQHQFTPSDEQVEQCDLVAQQRPGGLDGVRNWRRWQQYTRLVFETDDNLLDPDPSGLPYLLDPELRESVVECLRMASLVTCSTEPLADVLRRHVGDPERVTVVPNHIHEDLLSLEPKPGNPGRVTVGWAGGATHLQDLVLLQRPLKELRRSTLGWDLHFIGMDYRPLVQGAGRFTPWRPDVWDYYRTVDFDIALCPLADTAFNRCRTPIKAMEAAALGIPVLASDVEPYRSFVVDGVTGYLCRTETDWRSRLRELINDPAAREAMGSKAREVAADHTIQVGYQKWSAAYEEVCK